MSDQEKKEQEIMNQEMSVDEMETVAGGDLFSELIIDIVEFNKAEKIERNFYNPDGSYNCAATVEDGSWCKSNDACHKNQMVYVDMKDCSKAWK